MRNLLHLGGLSIFYVTYTVPKMLFISLIRKYAFSGDLQDGWGVRHGDHLPPHKYIRNASPHIPGYGKRKKKKERQKNRDGTCTSGREVRRRKSFHTLGSPFTGGNEGWAGGKLQSHGGECSNRGAEGKAERFPQRIGAEQHSPAQEACLLTCQDGWGLGAEARALEVGSQGEDWGWRREHSLKGLVRHS